MKVKNRNTGIVIYTIPDLHITREFAPNEVKDVAKEELMQLIYQPGGAALFYKYLQVGPKDLEELGIEPQEKEYFYSEQDIKDLILIKSLDEFLDTLDFAPTGVIEMIKSMSLTLPMVDASKMKAFKDSTGFDIAKALENQIAVKQDAATTTEKITRQRRVPDSKYKVISE